MGVRLADLTDLPEIQALLRACKLRETVRLDPSSLLWVVRDGQERVTGAGGVEIGRAGRILLRSVAVLPELRGEGLGRRIVETIYAWARATERRRLYLFSTDTREFWSHMGYREVPVEELVSELGDTPQIREFREIGWLPTEVAWRIDL
jgi:N-acetylglutamate synthase-like GNAT family acetyltransferase